MCDRLPELGSVSAALAILDRALDYLNAADVAGLPVDTQAAVLKSLEAAEAKHTAARAAMLSAFSANGGPEADGHGAARVWLRWQPRVTRGAAAGAVAWMRRLAAHPVIERALANGEISASWARELCAWTDRLPAGVREDADRLLCQAAADGADLADLARLAEAIYQRTRSPDDDDDEDDFGDRHFHLGITFSGAGRAQGDLTQAARPRCPRCWTRWARKPARRTPGPPRSAVTTPWRTPAAASSPLRKSPSLAAVSRSSTPMVCGSPRRSRCPSPRSTRRRWFCASSASETRSVFSP